MQPPSTDDESPSLRGLRDTLEGATVRLIRMARIEHVALWVSDLEAMVAFYAFTFSATIGALYENPGKGFASRFLSFEGGARLELMTTSAHRPIALEPGIERMGLTHLAIAVGSEAAVDEITSRLRAGGTVILSGPRRTGDGYYESVVLDPEGNRIEITAGGV
jgi:lactoylglutathione lyase